MTSIRTIRLGLLTTGLFAAIGVTAACAIGQASQSHGDPKLVAQAKVTPDAARAIAARAQPGTIKEWELEKEAGGSGLRYSFDIASAGKIYEVGIDAADGKILENGIETEADEASEAKEDSTKDDEEDEDEDDK